MNKPKFLPVKSFHDERGSFCPKFLKDECFFDVDQVNIVHNNKVGTFRGFHHQSPYPQAKYVFVIEGCIQDIIINLETMEYESYLIDAGEALYVPRNYSHGYLVLLPKTVVGYLVSGTYHPEEECGFRWYDPKLSIKWELEPLHISDKDEAWPLL